MHFGLLIFGGLWMGKYRRYEVARVGEGREESIMPMPRISTKINIYF